MCSMGRNRADVKSLAKTDEHGVAPNSKVETFAALRLWVKSWRWDGVPFFIRTGKTLPTTCTEVLVRLRRPPSANFVEKDAPQNYIRFRISPEMEIAIGANVMGVNQTLEGNPTEMIASRQASPEEMEAYERVLGDAMSGDPSHFAREDYVEEAWRIVDPIFKVPTPVEEYEPKTWGPGHADSTTTPCGGWHNPTTQQGQGA